jgi:hypothetical protein
MFLKFKKLLNNANKYFMKLQPKRVLSFGMALTVTFVAFNFNSAAYYTRFQLVVGGKD